ncbi:MAG: hypothetical protein V4574_16855 [Pseudomonadota bacterium]
MEDQPTDRPLSAFVLSVLLAAAIIAAALQAWPILIIAFLFIFIAVVLIGMPLYFIVRAKGRVNGWTAAAAGAVTGVAFPALLFVPFGGAVEGARVMALFALLGAVMGLAFLLLLERSAGTPRNSRARIGSSAALLAGAGLALFQFGFDHSCHNPAIRGSLSSYSVESFYLTLPKAEWPRARTEIEAFGRENGWSLLRDPNGREGLELCTARTLIKAAPFDTVGGQDQWSVRVEQPFGGDGWQAPFAALRRRIAAKWPDAIGDNNAPPPSVAPKAPTPSPAPSSAAR